MSQGVQAIVVGAGPTGLVVAAELAGAGIPCRILERRPERSLQSRAFGLQPHTLELLDMRGQADAMVERGLPWQRAALGDGKGALDFGLLDSRFPFMLVMPQSRTEEVLEAWALACGVDIVRNAQVTGLEQDESGITLQVEGARGTWTERAQFVVGCDGVRSSVRSLLGLPFHGTSYDCSLTVADVNLAKPPDPPVYARTSPRGMVAVFPFEDGSFRLVILDHERMRTPVDEPVTLEELHECSLAITGIDMGIEDPKWMSRFRSEQRQAEQYHVGNIILAGDAAHTHIPSGGQGLQVGIQDAFNLGWKLAATISGWAPPDLLDSYEHERKPVATATLRKTDLIFRYETSRALPWRVGRWLAMRLMALPSLQIAVMKDLAGLKVHYPSARGSGAHRLVGSRTPDTDIEQEGGNSARLYELLRQRKFVLLDQTLEGSAAAYANERWPARITIARGRARDRKDLPAAMLVRPDGFVAWGAAKGGIQGLEQALRRWCGEPEHLLTHPR